MLNKITSKIKDSYAGIFISLCLNFMLLFYEPLNIFANNLDDFWFDIYMFFPIIILQSLACFLILSLFFVLIRMINKRIYTFFVICFLIGTICTYIQGIFLSGSLPIIDGNWVDFDKFKTEKMISLVLWFVVGSIILFSLYKFKFKNMEKVSKYASIVIILMLSSSIFSIVSVKGFFNEHKVAVVSTIKNYSKMSKNKNFVIFLVDATDSYVFNKEVEKYKDKEELFEDFTYFPDTLGGYPYTRNSIPLILGGKWYENEGEFKDFYTDAIDNSELFKKLEKEEYEMNLYENDLNNYDSDKYTRFANLGSVYRLNLKELLKQEAKLIMYKYLPYQLKWRAEIDTLEINSSKEGLEDDVFKRFNIPNYERIKNDKLEIVDNNIFHFYHLYGAHIPMIYDINVNKIENGTYEGNVDACVTIIEAYLKKLKENNVYDNTAIVIMSDHGYEANENSKLRQNPILYIKGFNEKHDYEVSDKKVSFGDLIPAFNQLIDGDSSSKLFLSTDNEERRYLYHPSAKFDVLTEKKLTGNAWDSKALVDTGKEFVK